MMAHTVIIEYSQNGRLVETMGWLHVDRCVELGRWPWVLEQAVKTAAALVVGYGCGRAEVVGIVGDGCRSILATA